MKIKQPIRSIEEKSSHPEVALLVTTYNRFDALRLVLDTALNQSIVPKEIVICDDGSKPETTEGLRKWSQSVDPRISIVRVWQPDIEFRAARSRNLGLLRVSTPFVIMIDGDCLLPYRFIERHLALAEEGRVTAGGRYLLPSKPTEQYISEKNFDIWRIKAFKLFYIPLGRLRDLSPSSWSRVKTCNMGLYMDDVLRINGFDENYIGWGREDSDFVIRLVNSGVRIRNGRLATTVVHLYHPEFDRASLNANHIRFCSTLSNASKRKASKSCLGE